MPLHLYQAKASDPPYMDFTGSYLPGLAMYSTVACRDLLSTQAIHAYLPFSTVQYCTLLRTALYRGGGSCSGLYWGCTGNVLSCPSEVLFIVGVVSGHTWGPGRLAYPTVLHCKCTVLYCTLLYGTGGGPIAP